MIGCNEIITHLFQKCKHLFGVFQKNFLSFLFLPQKGIIAASSVQNIFSTAEIIGEYKIFGTAV